MWTKGRPRQECDGSRFFSGCIAERGLRPMARACEVDPRTIMRWANGTDRCPCIAIEAALEALVSMQAGWMPTIDTDMAIDGNTRVGGVGEYTIRSARGRRSHAQPNRVERLKGGH